MNLKNITKTAVIHLPYFIGVALVLINTLIANGDIKLSSHALDIVNAVLAAFGLGILHQRQLNK